MEGLLIIMLAIIAVLLALIVEIATANASTLPISQGVSRLVSRGSLLLVVATLASFIYSHS